MTANTKNGSFPLPSCGMYIGTPIYLDHADYVFQHTGLYYTTWVPEDHEPEWYLQKIIQEKQGNLAIFWDGGATTRCLKSMSHWLDLAELGLQTPEPDWTEKKFLVPGDWPEIQAHQQRFGAGLLKLVQQAAEKNLACYCIYADANPDWVRQVVGEPAFLGYNIGEVFSFELEKSQTEEPGTFREKALALQTDFTLQDIATAFSRQVKTFFAKKKQLGWNRFFSTTAAFHLDAEIAASESEIIPHIEGFAFRNLNFGMALCRGLYRQMALPAWGAYLAHEHYSFLPYSSPHKFQLLDLAFRMAYLNGSKITVCESGNWWLQSDHVPDSPTHQQPKIDQGALRNNIPSGYAHLVPEARKHYPQSNFQSESSTKFRRSIAEFYEFVLENGTPPGQPRAEIAAVKGRYDFCSQDFHPNMAVAAAFKLAEQNPSWYEGMPERGWELFRKVFFPLHPTLGQYQNRFCSGTPYGLCDIVSLAAELPGEFLLQHYRALLFTGWNSAVEGDYQWMKDYVYQGGCLFVSIPHLSKNIRRNSLSYGSDELIQGGDFSELCGVRIKQRGRQLYWVLMAENNPLGLPRHQRFGCYCTHMGEMDITGHPEILAYHDETFQPFLLKNRYGKGTVYFLNSWQYPGALDLNTGPGALHNGRGLIEELYAHIASENRGNIYITDDGHKPGAECQYIAWSFFPENDCCCMLNVDFQNPRQFRLHRNGQMHTVQLDPMQLKIC